MPDEQERTNTAPNRGGKPFKKGDPRINRKGRPRSFDALRELAQQIAHETATDGSGKNIVIAGHTATVAEMILRTWAKSNNAQLARGFIEIAYGKVPDDIRVKFESMTDEQKREYVRDLLAAGGYILSGPEETGVSSNATEEGGAVDAALTDAAPATGEVH